MALGPKPDVAAAAALGRERGDIERGMMLKVIGVMVAPVIHAIAKSLGGTLATGEIALARYLVQFVVLLPLLWVSRGGRIPPPALADLVRGLLLALATLSFFGALTFMPLADSSAIFFVEPLILTLLSAVFLGESIGWRRLVAVAVGFLGAMIVIRPSFEEVGPAALLPLVAAFCFAIYLTITRRRAKLEDGRVMQFWSCGLAALALGLALALGAGRGWPPLDPVWPAGKAWLLLAALGGVATLSQFLAIQAFRLAPASLLAPFQYLEIVGATLLGIAIFDDLPDAVTLLGIAIIVGSGLYVFWRERQLTRRERSSLAAKGQLEP